MRRLLLIPLFLLTIAFPAIAQQPWCGYALIEGLPLLENQLSVIAAITPPKGERSFPHELFQYRYNLARTAVIVEGCFQAEPTRDLVMTLLEQTVDVALPEAQATEGVEAESTAEPPTPREYIDSKLTLTRFAPDGTREESAAAVRAYLTANIREWEASE